MWYNINFYKLINLLLPSFLRKKVVFGFAITLTNPIISLYNNWAKNRNENLYKLVHNGQVCYLRKVLNDKLDPTNRRIYIGNGNKYDIDYIYTSSELKPKYLGTQYLQMQIDYADTGADFIVYVPEDLLNQNNYELKALLNFYKEGVKRYKIEPIWIR